MSYGAGMDALDDTLRLYDLLREAGEDPVTLDELAVAGVADPARALLDLELTGHAISRVVDERTECVRLAPFDGVHLLAVPDVEPRPVPAQAPGRRPLLVAAALLLLALLLARR